MSAPHPPRRLVAAIETYLRRYHRHEIHLDAPVPDEPALVVANHGFGGVIDLNVLALGVAVQRHFADRPVTFLVHQLAWTLGLGPVAEAMGCRPGSSAAVDEGFGAGHHVAVFPGGDIDAAKATKDRNRIEFAGRTGFARVAIEHGVPVVPVVVAGAGESLLVLSDGQALARALRLPELLRLKALPVSLSLPWGLSVGLVGMLPYAPLPTKLETAVLPAMRPEEGESAAAFAARIEAAMQTRMDELTAGRTPIVG